MEHETKKDTKKQPGSVKISPKRYQELVDRKANAFVLGFFAGMFFMFIVVLMLRLTGVM